MTSYLVPMGHQPSDMNKQAMCGDAARHEVVVQVADDIQLLSSNLFTHTNVTSVTPLKITEAKFSLQLISQTYRAPHYSRKFFDMITNLFKFRLNLDQGASNNV